MQSLHLSIYPYLCQPLSLETPKIRQRSSSIAHLQHRCWQLSTKEKTNAPIYSLQRCESYRAVLYDRRVCSGWQTSISAVLVFLARRVV